MVLIAQDCIVSFGSMDLGLYRVRIGSDWTIFLISLWIIILVASPELTVLDRPAFATTIGIYNYILGINTRRKSKTTTPISLPIRTFCGPSGSPYSSRSSPSCSSSFWA